MKVSTLHDRPWLSEVRKHCGPLVKPTETPVCLFQDLEVLCFPEPSHGLTEVLFSLESRHLLPQFCWGWQITEIKSLKDSNPGFFVF